MSFGTHSSKKRPQVMSYDSGHEYSLEHLLEVRRLVAEADEQTEAAKLRAVAPDKAGKMTALSAKAGAA